MPAYQFLKKPAQIEMFGEIKHWLRELFYCDDPFLYDLSVPNRQHYPWSVLLNRNSSLNSLLQVIEDPECESKAKILAHHLVSKKGIEVNEPPLLGIVLEANLDLGLNAFAIYQDGSFSYVNPCDKVILTDNPDKKIKDLNNRIFEHAADAVTILKANPCVKNRNTPAYGFTRISFLVGSKLYMGEGPSELLFNDTTFRKTLMGITIALGIQIAREEQASR